MGKDSSTTQLSAKSCSARQIKKRFFSTTFSLMILFLFCPSAEGVESQVRRLLECNCYNDVLFVSPGLTMGGTFTAPPDGPPHLVLGGELSVIFVGDDKRELFGGLVTEGVYDWNRRGARGLLAGVFGWRQIGVECGYLIDFSGDVPKHGGAVRLFATTGAFNFYIRYGLLINSADFVELGIQIKIPFPVWGL